MAQDIPTMSCWFTRAPATPGMLVRPPTADRTEMEGVMMPGQYSQEAVQSDHPRQTGWRWRG